MEVAAAVTRTRQGRFWLAAEVALLVVIVFFAGRMTVHRPTSPRPGAVDIGFSQDMAVHHEQAVFMANLAPGRAGVAVAALADAILVNQSQEIGLVRGWLQLWHQPTASVHPMAWMTKRSGSEPMPGMAMGSALPMGSTSMPGMAAPAELDRLATLNGTAFDVLFLRLMIRHHEGGLEMAQYAQAQARLALVRSAARAMAFAQLEDLGQLRALLTADGATPLPFP
jgi:uncharacterized protein (DUF305 family)